MKRSAFSFIEIMMVVFILCICILPLMGYIHGNARATGHTMDRSLAMTIASQTMERFRNLPYDDLVAKCGAAVLTEADLNNDAMLKTDGFPPELKKRYQNDSYARTVKFEEKQDPRLQGPAAANAKIGLLTVEISWKPLNLPDAKMTLVRTIPGHLW